MLATDLNKPTMNSLKRLNVSIALAKEHSKLSVKVQPIPLEQLEIICFADSA